MQIYQIVKYLKYIQYCNNWIFIHSHWWMNEKARHFHQKLLATAKGINCFANSFGAAAIFWQISKLTLLCTFWSSWQQFPAVYCPLKSVLTRRCLSKSLCSVSNASPPWDSSCLSGENMKSLHCIDQRKENRAMNWTIQWWSKRRYIWGEWNNEPRPPSFASRPFDAADRPLWITIVLHAIYSETA